MTASLITPSLTLCSLDSFLAAASLSFAGLPATRQRTLGLSFFAADSLASFAAPSLGLHIPAAAIAVTSALALLIMLNARRAPRLCLFLPVLLCLDNLASGTGTSVMTALTAGLASGTAAWLGFRSAAASQALLLRFRIPAALAVTTTLALAWSL